MGDLQQQLQALLETETSITSTWLANNLRITVNAACQALELYLSSHLNDVHASYLITGYDKNNNLQIAVVSSEDVGTFKTEALKKILSTKIFSIEKSASESLRSQIVDSCLQLADSLLKETSAVEDSFLTNTSGDITLKGLSVKSVGERIFSSQNLQYTKSLSSNPSVSSTTSKTETKVGKTSMESNQHEKTQSFFAKTSSSSSASATQPTKSTPTNAFFAVSSTTANPKGAISSQSSDDHFEVLQAPSKPKSKSTTQSRLDDDDEEWDDGEAPTVGHKRLNSSQEKAKPALEDSEDEEPLSAGTEHHEIPTAKKPKVGKSQNLTVRGAMDDFMEDVAIEQFKQEQAEMKNNEKKRNKVLVEKVTTNDKGYFITEMVWEEVTDNEETSDVKTVHPNKSTTTNSLPSSQQGEDNNEGKKEGKKAPTGASVTAAKSSKKNETKPSAGTQKSMMSFFAKK